MREERSTTREEGVRYGMCGWLNGWMDVRSRRVVENDKVRPGRAHDVVRRMALTAEEEERESQATDAWGWVQCNAV